MQHQAETLLAGPLRYYRPTGGPGETGEEGEGEIYNVL